MANDRPHVVAILGLSASGKTHLGGQLIGRFRQPTSRLQMDGAAATRQTFDAVLKCLQEGIAAEHTPTGAYGEETIGVVDGLGNKIELSWPDYGGEQLASIVTNRKVPAVWRERLEAATSWALLIRPGTLTLYETAASRPRAEVSHEHGQAATWDDNSRYIEMIQILLNSSGFSIGSKLKSPRLAIVMSCWDEVSSGRSPTAELDFQLPMFSGFVHANWSPESCSIWGLSSLGKHLEKATPDSQYLEQGPEQFGYVINPNQRKSSDLTELVEWLAASDDAD